jgi:arylformamidase
MTAYGHFSETELEAQYNVRAGRPDYETVIVPDWIARSERARAGLGCQIDVIYGPGPKQKLDLFPSGATDAPTLLYFHGGYWQRGDKSIYSFLAEPFVRHGVNVVVAGYDLCPGVTITRITDEAREAVTWLWRHGPEHGIAADRLSVMGHSAGGHITAMMMATDWRRLGDDLPADLVRAGIPVSPLNLLEPLRFTSINEALGMDEAEAEAQSPINNPPLTNAPQLVVCGGAETTEFQRQADIYVEAFATPSRRIERYSVPNCDHFDELNMLARDDSEFFGKSLALLQTS